ncbi:TetR family transcriptional regulator [Clostridium carboxidivorans P7]|uniref:Transcriptional regulator, TetR family n=1 Tax=Clostridium carboxidivorans P7 TaxID=536227 RepID=C6PTG7_9CLOT|nr:TetR/AcrR family transcriptional regulator [Clostridium carboxidivorans]AKN33726.1 TetR family transcriptional regulator [Clostridium carboxidivorans P7]EET87490.1 transcriptional regulator, TetR family [Clostridium carboxidivorans P7]EFG86675.1 transcriptional regulator, TetR family [Clostridium carboxidivorans P7]
MSDNWHEKVKNKNRDEIISAGKELFLKYNFLNVNIKDLCTLAGVSRVTFYKYFDSIEELIFEIHVDILNNMKQWIKSVDKLDASGIERLRLILNAWVDFGKQNKDQMKFIILFDLYYECYNPNEALKLRRENFLSKEINDHFLNSVINTGIKDRSLRGDLDVIKTGCYIFSTIMGVLQRMSSTALLYENQDTIFEEVAQSVVESILNYIKNNDSTV